MNPLTQAYIDGLCYGLECAAILADVDSNLKTQGRDAEIIQMVRAGIAQAIRSTVPPLVEHAMRQFGESDAR